MPYDGSGNYNLPSGTHGATGTPVESKAYNDFTDDIAKAQNDPRPIGAGGTGATSKVEALFNVGGEVATQVVTNYADHQFFPGSVRSTGGALDEPVTGHTFAGWCYSADTPNTDPPPKQLNLVIHARDLSEPAAVPPALPKPGTVYVREKKAGEWGVWYVDGEGTNAFLDSPHFVGVPTTPDPPDDSIDGTIPNTKWVTESIAEEALIRGGADNDIISTKLARDGSQTMTGDLNVDKANPSAIVTKQASGEVAALRGKMGVGAAAKERWVVLLGDNDPETGVAPLNNGSNFTIYSAKDDGTFLEYVLTIDRELGLMRVKGIPTDPFGVATKQYVDDTIPDIAEAADYLDNTPDLLLTTDQVWEAAAPVEVDDKGVGVWTSADMSLGIDFNVIWDVTGATRQFNFLNPKPGQKGVVYFVQPATFITAIQWDTPIKFAGGVEPVPTPTTGAIDVLSYTVRSATEIMCAWGGDYK